MTWYFFALFCLTFVTVSGADVVLKPTQYITDEWTLADGFPEETVMAIDREPNGYLWIGTANSLIRFDGQEVHAIYPSDPQSTIWSISRNLQNEIFVTTNKQGVLKLEKNQLIPVWKYDLGRKSIPFLRHDHKGTGVVLDGHQIFREKQDGTYQLWQELPELGKYFVEIAPGVWAIATGSLNLLVLDTNTRKTTSYPIYAEPHAIAFQPGQGLYIGTEEGLLFFSVIEGTVKQAGRYQKMGAIHHLTFDNRANLWIGGASNLYLKDHENFHPFRLVTNRHEEYIQNILSNLNADEEGNIWVSYTNGSLLRIRIPRFPTWSATEGLPGTSLRASWADGKGGAWVCTREGIAHINHQGSIRKVEGPWEKMHPEDLLMDDSGYLWIIGDNSVYRIDSRNMHGQFISTPVPVGHWALLFKGRKNEIRIGDSAGSIYQWNGSGWTDEKIEGVPESKGFRSMVEDHHGNLFLTVRGHGFYRIENRLAVPVSPNQEISRKVHSIYIDERNQIWMGLDGAGVGRLNGSEIQHFDFDPQIQTNSAFYTAADQSGFLWFGLRSGLMRVNKDHLEAYFDGIRPDFEYRIYRADNGLRSGNFGVARRTAQNISSKILWLPHLRGLMRIDSENLFFHYTKPPIHIQGVRADEVPLQISSGVVQIPPATERIHVDFHAIFLPEPLMVQYQHQLTGFQSSWIGPHYERGATFTKVPPGDFLLQVKASNSDGVWNDEIASIELKVLPAFYETRLFQVVVGLMVVGMVYSAVYLRLRKLRRDKQILEKRVEERTHELKEAKDIAEKAVLVKSEFLATMSHEIRTPLHGILGTLELLESCHLAGEQKEYVSTARRSGGSLLELLNDVLDLSRLEADQMVLRPEIFQVRTFLHELIAAFRHAAVVKGLSVQLNIDAEVPRFLMGDVARLRQILSNLIGNSIKFTDQGSVEMFADSKHIEEDLYRIRFRVKDTGMGIDPQKFDSLFKPFSQVDTSSKRRYSGTGLGLAISQRLAEKMDGKLSVQSEVGKGAEFLFEVVLPIGETPKALPTLDPDEKVSLLNGRILLVEDNKVNQLVASRMLSQLGCSVQIASDGIEGVQRSEEKPYDVILMDSHMPGASGIEATQQIRLGHGPNKETPIIGLSASSFPEERAACLASGMNGFLAKPYSLIQLQSMLAEYMVSVENKDV